jgi:hypothetical protein
VGELLQACEGMDDLLCFASDYPHHTMDDPTYAARIIPDRWHRKIFLENACLAYGWVPPSSVVPHPTSPHQHD